MRKLNEGKERKEAFGFNLRNRKNEFPKSDLKSRKLSEFHKKND